MKSRSRPWASPSISARRRSRACGELTSRTIREAVTGPPLACKLPVGGLIVRPPTFCPGCSHRGLYTVIAKLKLYVSGDIGCYTLGALPPFSSMHTCICMGASISGAHGISRGLALKGVKQKPVAVIGDSTFLHSGITGLIDMVYNGGDALVVIMNNDTTGMTGGQEHAGTGTDGPGHRRAEARHREALPGHRREARPRDRRL